MLAATYDFKEWQGTIRVLYSRSPFVPPTLVLLAVPKHHVLPLRLPPSLRPPQAQPIPVCQAVPWWDPRVTPGMIRKQHVLISKEESKWRSQTHDTRRNVWKGAERRGVEKQQMLLNLHQRYTQLRERYASEHALKIAKQCSALERSGYRLRKGWEEDQSGPESEGEEPNPSDASDSGDCDADFHIQYHEGSPGVRLEDVAGPSSYMEQLLEGGLDQPEGLGIPTATPTASQGVVPPAGPAVPQLQAAGTAQR